MKLFDRLLFLLVLFTLASCTPQATIAPVDDAVLKLVALPRGDVAVVADKPIEFGDARLAGEGLEIQSEFCATSPCVPNERGFYKLTFPDDGKSNYTSRIEIDVVAGKVERGRALMTLQGESFDREALLQRSPDF